MVLACEHVDFAYGKGRPILQDVSMTIGVGEVVGLVAPSGYGKTTLAKVLAGYLKPTKGKVSLNGQPHKAKGYNPVQLVLQHPEKSVNPKWKMDQILSEAWDVSEEIIEIVGIEKHWLGRWPNELSGGELQRFCLARALSPSTQFLIADEMTTMLDAISQGQIWKAVLSCTAKKQMGVLVISHDAPLVDRVCTRVVTF